MIGVCCLTPFAGLLVPDGRTLPDGPSRDFVLYQLPIREYARREILAGRFPLWIAEIGTGLPLHAGQQASLCHPLLTPLVLVCGALYALNLCLFLHLALSYAGVYCLARYLRISAPASSLAGIVATWSGFAVNHLMAGHVALILQYALVPWFFLALAVLLRQPALLPALGLAGTAFVLAVSGHPQVFYYTLLFAGLWAAGSLAAGSARRAPARSIAWMLAAALLGLLASSAQLLPAMELARDGMGASFRSLADFPTQHALSGLDIVRLIAPNLAGNPFGGPEGFGVGENFHERVVYLGLLTPLLACYGLTRVGAARWQWGAAALATLALAVSLGDSTPVFGWLVQVMHGLGLFRCPGRVFGVTSVLAALLAARGLDGLVLREGAAYDGRRLAVVAVVWCLATLAGTALAENIDGVSWRAYAAFARAHLVHTAAVPAAIAMITVAALWFAWRSGRNRPRVAYSLVALAALADLGCNNVRNFSLGRQAPVLLPEPLVAQGLPRRFVEGSAGAGLGREQLRYSHLVPAAIAARRQLLGTKEGGVLPAATERLFRAVQSNAGVTLALAGCDYACSSVDGRCQPLAEPLPRLRFFSDANAALVDIAVEEAGEDDLRRMRQHMTGEIRIVEDAEQRIAIEIDAPVPGRLTLADTWYPGWKASVDGVEVAIEPAHGVFRAIHVPEGRHRVVFNYDSRVFRLGVIVSAATIILSCGLLVIGLRQKVGQR
ncbi:MAG TPA: YfhO family protein [Pirellulales bacterium]|nr:YfhO family protein [Pirellulales bacterium]